MQFGICMCLSRLGYRFQFVPQTRPPTSRAQLLRLDRSFESRAGPGRSRKRGRPPKWRPGDSAAPPPAAPAPLLASTGVGGWVGGRAGGCVVRPLQLKKANHSLGSPNFDTHPQAGNDARGKISTTIQQVACLGLDVFFRNLCRCHFWRSKEGS